MKAREKEIFKVTIVGGIVNVILVVFKFVAGFLGHSSAMIADAFHSLSDFVSDIVVLAFVRVSGKPEDTDHAYGHGKYETLASLIVGVLLVGVGVLLAIDSIKACIDFWQGGTLPQPNWWALSAAIISILLKESLYHYTMRAAKKVDSTALAANAWHHRSDSLTSIAALIGIGGAMLLGPKWAVLDPLAAAIVSIFIVKASFSLMKPAVDELLEKSLPQSEIEEIEKIVSSTPGVIRFHHLRTRRVGPGRAIEMHIKMQPDMTLHDAHEIASELEDRLRKHFGNSPTHLGIHMEPENNNDAHD